MKTKYWLCLPAILLCLGAFVGYQALDRIRTDLRPPEITFAEESVSLSVKDPLDTLLQGVTAADRRDGDVTGSLVVERIRLADSDGTLMVSYAAFDAAGNVAQAERAAVYTDYHSPRFSLSEPLLYPMNSGFDILDSITATDVLDGDISHRIRAASADGTSVGGIGSHEVEFQVTNSLGETVRMVLPVEVYPTDTYALNLKLTDYLVYLETGSSFDPHRYLASVSLNREEVSLSGGVPDGFSVKTTGTVNTRVPGVYVVDYTITESDGYTQADSQARTGCSRLIVVVEG